ncbi:MAG: hypothetical protein M3410_06805 [Acidobacteriota bacterium]|nr:hypothetical protein [Acidobacteriota bacterium]
MSHSTDRAAEQLIPADPRQLGFHQGCRVPCCLRGRVARAAEFGRYTAREAYG